MIGTAKLQYFNDGAGGLAVAEGTWFRIFFQWLDLVGFTWIYPDWGLVKVRQVSEFGGGRPTADTGFR